MPDHPSEELLSTYALDPSLVEDAAGLDAHLDGCAPCRGRLAVIRESDALLAEGESWPDAGDVAPPAVLRALSAVAARNRREDADADARLGPVVERFLTASSTKFVWDDIASKSEYHTGGVVRKLADAADRAQYSAPLRALILGETASAIVGMLSRTTYTDTEIAALRGLAWKQQANANRQLGRFNAALEALQRAERAYRELPLAELDLASISFIRGTIYCEQQTYDLAAQYAEESAGTFAQLRQTDGYIRCRHLSGAIAFEERRLGDAQLMFDEVLAHGEATGNVTWIAAASLALGNCYVERREFASASLYLHQSMVAFRDLGILDAQVHCRWGLALVLQRSGHHRRAVTGLQEVRDEFLHLEKASDAALVTLDIVETFLLLGKHRQMRKAAGHIVRLFKDAGMVSGALTAADYLKQAAVIRRVTPSLIDYIRRYFRRVDLQPDLVFVAPVL